MKKMSGVSLAVAMLVLVGVNRVQGTMVFSDDFSYADGPLAGNGAWLTQSLSSVSPNVSGGAAVGDESLGWSGVDGVVIFSDVFSLANFGTISFDLRASGADNGIIVGHGSSSGGFTTMDYIQSVGIDFGAETPYAGAYRLEGGSYNYSSHATAFLLADEWHHFVMSFTKSGTTVTLNTTLDGSPFLTGSGYSFTMNDSLNSLEFFAANFSGYPALSGLDNLRVESGGDVPEPGTLLILGGSLIGLCIGGYRRFRRK